MKILPNEIIGVALAILLSSFGCSPKQPLFNLNMPTRVKIQENKAMLIRDGPNSGFLVFPNGIVHLGPNPKLSYKMDTGSYFRWGIVKETSFPKGYTILLSYPRNSGDPFRPIYDLDSVRIDLQNLTSYEFGSKSSAYIKIDTIDYPFPVESVLLYKKLFKNSKSKSKKGDSK